MSPCSGAASVHSSSSEGRGREAVAVEDRAHGQVQSEQETALPLRRLHEPQIVSFNEECHYQGQGHVHQKLTCQESFRLFAFIKI